MERQRLITAFTFFTTACFFIGTTTFRSTLANAAEGNLGLMTMSLEELLDLEVTTASKKSETVTEAPAFTHVITKDQIQRFGYRTVAEALSGVIGFHFNSDLVYDSMTVRGFGIVGDFQNRILVLIDGQRTNDAVEDWGAVGHDFVFDIEGIKRIEIVKGPGSALWGNNALLAVVNVVPEKGADIDGVEASIEESSLYELKAFAKAGKKFDNGFEIAGTFSGLRTESTDVYVPGRGTARDNNEWDAIRGYLQASYKAFDINLMASQLSRTVPTGEYGTFFNSQFLGSSVEDTYYFAQGRFKQDLLPDYNGHVIARLFSNIFRFKGEYEYDTEDLAPLLDPYYNHDRLYSYSWGGEFQFSMDPHPRVSVTSGVEYNDTYKTTLYNGDIYEEYNNIHPKWSSLAGYLQTQIQAHDMLKIILGGRVDDYSHLPANWSPRVALILTPFEGTTLKALYGEAFRAPNAFEREFTDEFYIANDSIDPETITTWEGIWDQRLAENTRLVASVFQYKIEDLIAEVGINGGDNIHYENTGSIKIRGVEAMLQSHFSNGIVGHVGFSALWPKQTLINSPEFLGTVGLSVPLFSNKLHASTEMQAVAARNGVNGTHVGSTFKTNLTLLYKPYSWLDVTFGIDNLFDETIETPSLNNHYSYDVNGDPVSYTQDLRLPGRSFRGQIRIRY
jgi:iron complex outermembrane receptor protein